MKYTKEYISKTNFQIYYVDEFEHKPVLQGLLSPKVIAWLAEGNQLEVVNWIEPDLATLKAQKIEEFKSKSAELLTLTDYKFFREFEQKELIKAGKLDKKSLLDSEFLTLLEARQAIRDKSNELEALVNSKTTYDEISKVVW